MQGVPNRSCGFQSPRQTPHFSSIIRPLMSQQYLSGIRVLDVTRVLAGPICTMLLGDLGADIVKIERPGRGDDTRSWGPPFNDSGASAYYLSVNRNKLSVAADLDVAADRSLVGTLA